MSEPKTNGMTAADIPRLRARERWLKQQAVRYRHLRDEIQRAWDDHGDHRFVHAEWPFPPYSKHMKDILYWLRATADAFAKESRYVLGQHGVLAERQKQEARNADK